MMHSVLLPLIVQKKNTLRGAYGEVRLAFAKKSLDKYAIKIISKKKFTIGQRNPVAVSF